MHINLIGLPFDQNLVTELEQALLQKGFNLNDFTFDKAKHYSPIAGATNGSTYIIEYDYTVHIINKRFSITFSDDANFFRFFFKLCCPPEDTGHHPVEHLIEQIFNRAAHYTEVTKHWLTEESFLKHK